MWRLMFLILMVAAVGCGSGNSTENVSPEPVALQSKEELKDRLRQISESGHAGSGIAGLKEGLEKVGDQSLLADLRQLENAQAPQQVQAIAKRMADRL